VSDVQNADRLSDDCVKNLEWVSDKRDHAHSRALWKTFRTFWNDGNARDRRTNIRLQRRSCGVAKCLAALFTNFF